PGPLRDQLAPLFSDAAIPVGADALESRFRLHTAIADWLGTLSDRPLVLMLDDLHRADGETLAILRSLTGRLARAGVLLVAAYRPAEIAETMTDTFAELARHAPVRLSMAGLAAAEPAR